MLHFVDIFSCSHIFCFTHGRLYLALPPSCSPLVYLRILKLPFIWQHWLLPIPSAFLPFCLWLIMINFLCVFICDRFKFTMGLFEWLTSILVSLSSEYVLVCVKKTVLCDCLHLVRHWGRGGYCRTKGYGKVLGVYWVHTCAAPLPW